MISKAGNRPINVLDLYLADSCACKLKISFRKRGRKKTTESRVEVGVKNVLGMA